jgi:hypothetical protein
MAAHQIVVAMKSSKNDGAKGLAFSVFVDEQPRSFWNDCLIGK